jgi:8-oxo-dGTP pyrophosphatase MutT (NUDIX family)
MPHPGPKRPRRHLRRVDEVSAGGLTLRSSSGRLADVEGVLIGKHDRRGRLVWTLPKGKMEAGETRQQTAIREIREETGITGEVLASLGSVEYWFVADGRRIHKTVHHYLLRATGGELSTEDAEVSDVAWVPLAKIAGELAYSDERDLIATVPELWTGST